MNGGVMNQGVSAGSVMKRGVMSSPRARNNYWLSTGLQPISIAPTFQWRPGREDVPSIVTATRASTATRINEVGLIEQVANDVVRIDHDPITGECLGALCEEARTNLLTYSENFDNAAWAISANNTIAPNTSIAPDGTLTADTISVSSSGPSSRLQVVTIAAGSILTVSTFVKKTNADWIQLAIRGQSFSHETYVWFNIQSGYVGQTRTVGTQIVFASAKMYPCVNGYYRLSVSCNTNSTTVAFFSIRAATEDLIDSGLSGDSYIIWGAQLEAGAFPTSYIPSSVSFTSRASTATYVGSDGLIKSAAIDTTRMNYNPTNLIVAPKLLVEGASTNLLTYSEDFSSAAWIKYSTTIAANAAAAPDGSTTAGKLTEASDTSKEHSVYYIRSGSNETVTFSAFVKRGERTKVSLVFSNFLNATANADFDLVSGTVSWVTSYTNVDYSNVSATITPYYDGYFRCSITATKGSVNTTNNGVLVLLNDSGIGAYNGDGTSGLYIWGAQLESGPLSSYIPTTTAAVTRAADVSSSAAATRAADVWTVPVSSFAFNKDEGTLYANADTAQPNNLNKGTVGAALFSDTTHFVGALFFGWQSDYGGYAYNVSPISIQNTGYSEKTYYKNAVGYKAGDYSSVVGGGIPIKSATGGAATVPTMTSLYIGSKGGLLPLNGHIRHIAYFPRRISDSNLQLLTA